MNKQNNTINHREFLQRFTVDQGKEDEFEKEQLFEQEAEEGWKLVKNRYERIEMLDKNFEEKVHELNKKSALKGAAPVVAIAASILLILGLFVFMKDRFVNESKVVSEIQIPVIKNEKKAEPIAEFVQSETERKEVEKDTEVKIEASKKTNKKQAENLKSAETITENQSFKNSSEISAQEVVATGGVEETNAGIVAIDASAKAETDEKPEELLYADSYAVQEGKSTANTMEKKKRTQIAATRSGDELREINFTKEENAFRFKGGDKAFNDFITTNRKPISELKADKIFKAKIKIATNGKANLDELLNADGCEKCVEEIKRLVNNMPNWEKVSKAQKSTAVEWQEIEVKLLPQ